MARRPSDRRGAKRWDRGGAQGARAGGGGPPAQGRRSGAGGRPPGGGGAGGPRPPPPPQPGRRGGTTGSGVTPPVQPSPARTGSGTPSPKPRARVTATKVATTTGPATRPSVAAPRAACRAVTMPPIQARKVPSIHHTGRYHQVLPPPLASQVQGYALNGRSTTMSTSVHTSVPTHPSAAAPAMPSTSRAPPT